MSQRIPLFRPELREPEIEAVAGLLRAHGAYAPACCARFEQAVAHRIGRRHGIAVATDTCGFHLLLLGLGLGPGDEVIAPPFAFPAALQAILHAGARPVFVDIDPATLNLDPAQLEAAITERTRAILAAQTLGNPAGLDRLAAIARTHEIPFLEDAREAFGGLGISGRKAGTYGRAGLFSFAPEMPLAIGGGAMIVTDDDTLAATCRALREPEAAPPEAPGPGYGAALNPMAAALGLAQLDRVEAILAARRRVAGMYMRRLMDWEELILPTVEASETYSWPAFVVRLTRRHGRAARDRILAGLERHEIGAGAYHAALHLAPPFPARRGDGDFPVAEASAGRTLSLPFFPSMDETHVELVTHTLKVMLQREQLLRREE